MRWIGNNLEVRDNYFEGINQVLMSGRKLAKEDRIGKQYFVYIVVLEYKDSSGNTATLEIEYRILDTSKPINGKIEISYDGTNVEEFGNNTQVYTNSENIYFKFSGASEVTGNNNLKYQYRIIVNDNIIDTEWKDYVSGFEIIPFTINTISKVQIVYRVIDSVKDFNISDVIGKSILIVVDRKAPSIKVEVNSKIEEEKVKLENGAIYTGDNEVIITFGDFINEYNTGSQIHVRLYKNNQLTVSGYYNGEKTIPVRGFGHYRLEVTDSANNSIKVEFVILKGIDEETNTYNYTEVSRDNLADPSNAKTNEVKYDRVILQQLSREGDSFHFDDMGSIGDNDLVYFMGVVPEGISASEAGKIFSIYSGYVSGKAFKGFEDLFRFDIHSNISDKINENLNVNDYIINFNGNKYILIAIINGEGSPGHGGAENKPGGSEGDKKEEDKGEVKPVTIVLYGLGGIAAIGGIFLVISFRKKVRAA